MYSSNDGYSRQRLVFTILVLNVLELDLRPRDEDAESAHFEVVCAWQLYIHVEFFIDIDLYLAADFTDDSEVVVSALLVLPGRPLGTVLFAALADDQVRTSS